MQFFFRFFFITVVVFLFIRSANKAFTTASFRGYSGFQVTWMIEWGQKSKPQKIIGPKINPPPKKKNSIHNYVAGIRGQTTNLQLNQAIQENSCQIFLPQKNPGIESFKPKKSFDHPCHLKTGVPPPPCTPPRVSFHPKFLNQKFCL